MEKGTAVELSNVTSTQPMPTHAEPTATETAASDVIKPDCTITESTTTESSELESKQEDTAPADINHDDQEDSGLGGIPLVLMTVSMMLALFATEMDRTIVSTIVPNITSEFGSLDAVGWYAGAYLLIFSSFLPVIGQFYRAFQHNLRGMFVASLAIFEIGSVICAVAKSSSVFIFGRAFSGLGGGGILVGGLCVIGDAVPLRRRALFYSIITSVGGISALVGPPVGGLFNDSPKLGWRWCFWINLPIGAVAILTFLVVYRPKSRDDEEKVSTLERLRSIDAVGAILITVAMVVLLIALQWGGSTYSWKDAKVWALLIVFGVLMTAFIVSQYFLGDRAVFPPRVMKIRSVALGSLFAFLLPLGQYVHIYYLPMYFQSSRNLSARTSGLYLIAYLLSAAVFALATGAVVSAVGYYKPFMTSGAALFTIGSGVLYMLYQHHGVAVWLMGQLLAGSGMGLTGAVFAIALQAVLPPEDLATSNSLVVFLINIGGVVGSNIGQVIFSNTLVSYIRQNVPGVDPAVVVSAGATEFKRLLSPDSVALVEQGFAFAVSQAFLVAIVAGGLATIVSLGVEGRNLKKKQG